jgi:fructose-bisphosphate aldolase class 1
VVILRELNTFLTTPKVSNSSDIEPFFKFLKQHLNLNHLVSRNENGRRVMIYMTLIIAILIIAYKKLNKISSLKIAKFMFCRALESMIVKDIVILSGGDFEKVKYLFNDT